MSTICEFSLRLSMERDGSVAKLLLHNQEDHSLRPRVDKTKTTPHKKTKAKQQQTKQNQNLGKVACVYKPNAGEVETGGSLACWPTSPAKSANSRPMTDPLTKWDRWNDRVPEGMRAEVVLWSLHVNADMHIDLHKNTQSHPTPKDLCPGREENQERGWAIWCLWAWHWGLACFTEVPNCPALGSFLLKDVP